MIKKSKTLQKYCKKQQFLILFSIFAVQNQQIIVTKHIENQVSWKQQQ